MNDGAWHHVVGTPPRATAAEAVRRRQLGQHPGPRTFTGYWRAGADVDERLGRQPRRQLFVGDLEELAVYTAGLTAGQVNAHYDAGVTLTGGGTRGQPRPTRLRSCWSGRCCSPCWAPSTTSAPVTAGIAHWVIFS